LGAFDRVFFIPGQRHAIPVGLQQLLNAVAGLVDIFHYQDDRVGIALSSRKRKRGTTRPRCNRGGRLAPSLFQNDFRFDKWSRNVGTYCGYLGKRAKPLPFQTTLLVGGKQDFNSYLRAVTGSLPNTKNTEQPQPSIWEEDPPTTRAEALKRWEIARERFRRALDESQRWQQLLESLRHDVIAIPRLAKADDTAARQYSGVVRQVKHLYQQHQNLSPDLQSASEELRIHALAKPGFWARLFRTKAARQWKELHTALLDLKQKESAWKSARAEHEKTKRGVAEAQQRHGIEIADSAFFEQEHCEKHQATPWWPIAAQRARDEVVLTLQVTGQTSPRFEDYEVAIYRGTIHRPEWIRRVAHDEWRDELGKLVEPPEINLQEDTLSPFIARRPRLQILHLDRAILWQRA
jgi:hypothetical protein